MSNFSMMQNLAAFIVEQSPDGQRAICSLQRFFGVKSVDGDSGHRVFVVPTQFISGLESHNIFLNDATTSVLLNDFDTVQNGSFDATEFCRSLRQASLDGNRQTLVQQVFQKFAKGKSAESAIGVAELCASFQFNRHPNVTSGQCTAEEAKQEFSDLFGHRSHPSGSISYVDFEAIYAGVSISIDCDEFFDLLMNFCWSLEGNAQQQLNECGSTNTQSSKADYRKNLPPGAIPLATHKVRKPPRRIVGYTGHVPGSQEIFGVTFDCAERQSRIPSKKIGLTQASDGTDLLSSGVFKHDVDDVRWTRNTHSHKLE